MRSDMIKKGFERAPHRSLLKATGVSDEDMGKPFIAIANSYIDIIPGHVHLNEFGEVVRQAVREAGGILLQFPFYFLGLLASTVQALVFTLLATIYFALMLPHHDHEGAEAH